MVVVFVDLREYVGRTWVEKEVVWVGVDVGLEYRYRWGHFCIDLEDGFVGRGFGFGELSYCDICVGGGRGYRRSGRGMR